MTPRKLARRYRSAYRAAMLINGLGMICQVIGLILGAALLCVGVVGAQHIDGSALAVVWVRDTLGVSIRDQQQIVVYTGLILGAILLVLFWLVGTFVSAIGQMLKAILDTAVNTSPFLTTEEKQNLIP